MKQFDIVLVGLDPVVGREQSGTRPVLVISNDYENDLLNNITVIPITSLKDGRKIYPNEYFLSKEVEKPSILLCHQIRTISKKRVIKYLSSIESLKKQKEILDILCFRFEQME